MPSDGEKALLGSGDFNKVKDFLQDKYGTKADDKIDDDGNVTNEPLAAFIDEMGDVNYYTCTALLILDPNQEFESIRGKMKMILLPLFQLVVPFSMCWYFLVEKQLVADNGYCCNHGNYIFRFTGFVTFLYSAWQIIDGCDDSSSSFFMHHAVKYWSYTGRPHALQEVGMFYLCYCSQTLCSLLLLFVTLIIYTSQSDTPLDLLMNCVAVNFVLDIDSEWMDDIKQKKSQVAASFLFRRWRDGIVTHEDEIRDSMRTEKILRRNAPNIVKFITVFSDGCVAVLAYFFVFGWTFCPPQY